MPLHPQCKTFLDGLAAMGGKPIHELTPEEARARSLAELGCPIEEIAKVEDRTIAGVPVRVYTPMLGKTLPVLVYFHGGGYVIGNLDSHHRECRTLANQAGCAVIAVDYRLAPEHPYPAAREDAYAATCYVAANPEEFNVDPRRIAVGGDSAGGALAAVVALMARDRKGPRLAFQLLIYPCTDANAKGGSMDEFADGPFLTAQGMDWFNANYFSRAEDRTDPYGSPLYASDLSGLPPAFVLTAECDPIRDQGEEYARRLQAAGVKVAARRYEGMFHPFFSLGGVIDGAREAHRDAAFELRMALA